MLFSIASANDGYRGVQPSLRSFALLTRLLLSPRLYRRVDAAVDEDQVFCFEKCSARFARRFGLTLFGNPRSIRLRVDTAAAGKNDYRTIESIQKIACAV